MPTRNGLTYERLACSRLGRHGAGVTHALLVLTAQRPAGLGSLATWEMLLPQTSDRCRVQLLQGGRLEAYGHAVRRVLARDCTPVIGIDESTCVGNSSLLRPVPQV